MTYIRSTDKQRRSVTTKEGSEIRIKRWGCIWIQPLWTFLTNVKCEELSGNVPSNACPFIFIFVASTATKKQNKTKCPALDTWITI